MHPMSNLPAMSLVAFAAVVGCGPAQTEHAGYLGSSACAECHVPEVDAWTGSHHDLAMLEATDETVLGNFDDQAFQYVGVTSTFFRRDGGFWVRTDGPDGQLAEYEIKHTFGVDPLQQYLIEFPGGRLQAFGIAWDTRPAAAGGQRWFHLYPDDSVVAGDELHWTGPNQNWNYQCAECHSTDLRKNYDGLTATFATSWSDINVGCEACHGPGEAHVTWADRGADTSDAQKALVVDLGSAADDTWTFVDGQTIATRTRPREAPGQVETCARCHARRGVVWEDYVHGRPLADTHRPALLSEGLYHADGQIQDEVYVYGSFVQSKMYQAGVTCSDCHDPHSLQLGGDGNATCARCHLTSAYDTPDHHFHSTGSAGASCVECHMPSQTYMVVDPRRDHSFRVPRPDLSDQTLAPDACTQCHTDQSSAWAAAAVRRWYPNSVLRRNRHYGKVFAEARLGDPSAAAELARIIADTAQAGIVRATAAGLLRSYPSQHSVDAIALALRDQDPWVRQGALVGLDFVPPSDRVRLLFEVLDDSIRTIRINAARALAIVPRASLGTTGFETVERVLAEYVTSQLANADRPESYLNLGSLHAERGDSAGAEEALRTALNRDSTFVQAYVNLADLYRAQNRETEGEALLRTAIRLRPDAATAYHSLGLLEVRKQQYGAAVVSLARAAELAPEVARYGYVLGVALHSVEQSDSALAVLEAVLAHHPFDRDVLLALASTNRDLNRMDAARRFATRFAELWPEDPRVPGLLQAVGAR